MLRILPKSNFGKYKFNSTIIGKVSALLKVKPNLANEDINFFGDVRLLDSQNKLVGVFACEEARKKANKLGQDLVMINQEVKPALCKVCDYSDELALRFLEDIVKIREDGKNSEQSIKIGHTITIQDLKLKANQAKDIMKKQNTLRVSLVCPIDTTIESKSILYTFRDLVQSFMIAKQDIKMKEYREKEQLERKKKDDKVEQIVLEYDFETLVKNEIKLDLPQIKIERLINQYHSKSLQEKTEDEQDIADLFKTQKKDKAQKVQGDKKTKLEEMMDDDEYDIEFSNLPQSTSSFYIKDHTFAKYVKLYKLIDWSQNKK